MQELKKHIQSLYPFVQKRLGFNRPPRIFFAQDKENAENVLGKTAFYDPENFSITLYTTGRHPKDILRSLAHELVHHTQNCRGDLGGHIASEGGYAQNDAHLREMEREAYEQGNLCFRDWEDSIKYGGEQTMSLNEQTLRSAIRGALRKLMEAGIADNPEQAEAAEAAESAAGAAKQSAGADAEEATMSAEETEDNLGEAQEAMERVKEDIAQRTGDTESLEESDEESENLEEAELAFKSYEEDPKPLKEDEDELEEGGLANRKGDPRQRRPEASPIREEEDASEINEKEEDLEEDINTIDGLNEWYYNNLNKTLIERFTRK